jgi:hypothetical protein
VAIISEFDPPIDLDEAGAVFMWARDMMLEPGVDICDSYYGDRRATGPKNIGIAAHYVDGLGNSWPVVVDLVTEIVTKETAYRLELTGRPQTFYRNRFAYQTWGEIDKMTQGVSFAIVTFNGWWGRIIPRIGQKFFPNHNPWAWTSKVSVVDRLAAQMAWLEAYTDQKGWDEIKIHPRYQVPNCQGNLTYHPSGEEWLKKHPAAPANEPRSEKDRLRDFFFGKPGSRKARGLNGLPSWDKKR